MDEWRPATCESKSRGVGHCVYVIGFPHTAHFETLAGATILQFPVFLWPIKCPHLVREGGKS